MWTSPQIEAESLRKQPGTLSRPRPVRRGKGKTGVGDTVEGKGVNQAGGEGRRMPSRRYTMCPDRKVLIVCQFLFCTTCFGFPPSSGAIHLFFAKTAAL
jgi:hypothetical protein